MRPTVGSLFSGVGGIDLGLDRAGWETIWQVELDPECRRVLAHHWPGTLRLEDIRHVGAHNLPRVDLIAGGFPCQDLSVAGRRAGLAGARSGLFHEFARVVRELQPPWLLVENVPGLLSSSGGRDFAVVLHVLGECGYGLAWRVLNAQHFGVAQRRHRVFLVGRLGAPCPAEVLFESESCPGHPPAGREAGPGVAAGAQDGAGGVGYRKATRPHGADDAERWEQDELTGTLNGWEERHDPPPHLVVANALTASYGKQLDNSDRNGGPPNLIYQEVAATLKQRGRGACDEVMDNLQVVPTAYQCQGTNVGEMGTLRSGNGHLIGGVPFTFSNRQGSVGTSTERLRACSHGALPMVAHTLSAEGSDASEDGTGRGTPLVPLMAAGCANSNGAGIGREGDPAMTLDTTGAAAVGNGMAVRRLTPRECERLMGLPDHWTAVGADGKPISDSARYRMLGNSVVTNVVKWIGRRILEALPCP